MDDVIERIGDIDALDDAARAEAWVSGLFGELRDASLDAGREVDALGIELLAELERHIRTAALSIALVAERYPEDELRLAASHTTGILEDHDVSRPQWAADLGHQRALKAWSVISTKGNRAVVLEYGWTDTVDHTLLVEIDEVGRLADLQVGPAGMVDALHDVAAEGDDDSMLDVTVAELPLTEAAGLVLTAFEAEPLGSTDGLVMNHLMAATRLDLESSIHLIGRPVTASAVERPPRDADADAEAARVVISALRREVGAPAPEALVAQAAGSLRSGLDESDPDVVAIFRVAGVSDASGLDDVSLLTAAAGGYAAPFDLRDHPADERAVILTLEWADWLGAVIELVRAGPGTAVEPDTLVQFINRCPEVTSSVSKRDAPRVAWAFTCVLHAWERTGVIEPDGTLGVLGAWLLPRALVRAWGGAFDAPA